MLSMAMGTTGRMETTGFRAERAAAGNEIRVAYETALVHLRMAQRHLARPEGRYGADANPILAGEIAAAIGAIRFEGMWEFESKVGALREEGSVSRYSAALDCLVLAEQALAKLSGREVKRQALVHVRVAQWWVRPKVVQAETAPRNW